MPLKTWDTQADWDAAYDIGAEPLGHPNTRPGVRLHYTRTSILPMIEYRTPLIAAALGWDTSTRVVVAGAGYGWMAEILVRDNLVGDAIGIDPSNYIHGSVNDNDDVAIDAAITAVGLDPLTGEGAALRTDIRSRQNGLAKGQLGSDLMQESLHNSSRTAIRSRMGGPHNWEVFSEELLESLTDQECIDASDAAHSMTSGRVTHLVTPIRPNQDPGYNWKTLEEWKALLPADTFIETGTLRVL